MFFAGALALLIALVYEPAHASLVFTSTGSAIAAPQSSVSTLNPVVSEKLLREFHQSFPDATDAMWEEEKQLYVVSFKEQGRVSRILYNKDGQFISLYRNYDEHNLPYYLVSRLKNEFPGQKIFGVTEVTSGSNVAYFVKLEGPKRWMTIELNSNGDYTITDSYRKAS